VYILLRLGVFELGTAHRSRVDPRK